MWWLNKGQETERMTSSYQQGASCFHAMRELWKMMAFLQLLLCAQKDANPVVRSYINNNTFPAPENSIFLCPNAAATHLYLPAGTATHPGVLHQDLKSASQTS